VTITPAEDPRGWGFW